jgi:hypothetical protein
MMQAKDRIDEAQLRLKSIKYQQSLAGGGNMTWRDFFMYHRLSPAPSNTLPSLIMF